MVSIGGRVTPAALRLLAAALVFAPRHGGLAPLPSGVAARAIHPPADPAPHLRSPRRGAALGRLPQPARRRLARPGRDPGRVRFAARAINPVLVLDSGDTIQGTPFEQFPHVRWSEPSPTIAAMNLIGYDAMAVGNHEFNFGLEVLRRAESQADFPFLSANTVDDSHRRTGVPDAHGDRGRRGPGRNGRTRDPEHPGLGATRALPRSGFRAMDEVAREQVRLLREDEGCDLVVVLAHTGFEQRPRRRLAKRHRARGLRLAAGQIPGIDVLLTGHTHKNIPPRELNGAIVSQPRARARLPDPNRPRARARTATAGGSHPGRATTSRSTESRRIRRSSAPWPSSTTGWPRPSTALWAEVSEPVSVAGCRLRDCAALDLIHQVQLEASGADLSLASLLTDRTPDLPPGPVTWRWIYAFYVYPNTLVKVAVTGAEVKDILEHAARYYSGLDCGPSAGCTVLTDPAVPHYNVDTMAGVQLPSGPHPGRWATGCAICGSVAVPSIFTTPSPWFATTIAPPVAAAIPTSRTPTGLAVVGRR